MLSSHLAKGPSFFKKSTIVHTRQLHTSILVGATILPKQHCGLPLVCLYLFFFYMTPACAGIQWSSRPLDIERNTLESPIGFKLYQPQTSLPASIASCIRPPVKFLNGLTDFITLLAQILAFMPCQTELGPEKLDFGSRIGPNHAGVPTDTHDCLKIPQGLSMMVAPKHPLIWLV